MRVISELIAPIGSRRNRDRARNANLPIFDEFVFVPWDDPGNDIYGESMLTHRIRSILSFVQTTIVPLLKKEYQQSTSIVSAVCNIILSITERSTRVGNGLGRGVH